MLRCSFSFGLSITLGVSLAVLPGLAAFAAMEDLALSTGNGKTSSQRRARDLFAQGLVKSSAGDNIAAIKDFSSCLDLEPRCAAGYAARADCEFGIGQNSAALKDVETSLGLYRNPKSGDDYWWIVRAKDVRARASAVKASEADHSGQVGSPVATEPQADLEKVVQAYGASRNALECFRAAFALTYLERKSDALGMIDRAIEIEPGNSNYHEFRAYRRMESLYDKAALEDWNAVIELNPSSFAIKTRASLRERMRDYKGAKSDLYEALKRTDSTDEYRNILSWLVQLNLKLNDRAAAIECYDRIIGFYPDIISLKERAKLLVKEYRLKEAMGDLNLALHLLESAREKKGSLPGCGGDFDAEMDIVCVRLGLRFKCGDFIGELSDVVRVAGSIASELTRLCTLQIVEKLAKPGQKGH